ncbi:MAG TPA: polyphenol oxidase family protein [Longimicrobiales bacterium]
MTASLSVRVVEERLAVRDGVPLYVLQEFTDRMPWLVAGTTGAGDGTDDGFDLGLFGSNPVGESIARWRAVLRVTGMRGAAHSRQAHETRIQLHAAAHEGLLVSDGFDGHMTRAAGLLLTVSIADCVPVFLVDENARAIALLHAGWRGVAGGMLEHGIDALRAHAGSRPERLRVHAGPSICGECYEVGPEVHEALGLPRPSRNTPVDLRGVLARRAVARGVEPDRMTVSAHCTRCGPRRFFSHRGGERGRQMGVLGLKASGDGR